MAEKVVSVFSPELGDAVELGEDIELTEVAVERGSRLDGVTIRNAGIREETAVSARMVARELRGEDVLEPASQIRVIQVPATPFAGQTIVSTRISERTSCRIVAIEDDSGLTTQIEPERELDADDRLTLVGADDSVQKFLKQYDLSPTE